MRQRICSISPTVAAVRNIFGVMYSTVQYLKTWEITETQFFTIMLILNIRTKILEMTGLFLKSLELMDHRQILINLR